MQLTPGFARRRTHCSGNRRRWCSVRVVSSLQKSQSASALQAARSPVHTLPTHVPGQGVGARGGTVRICRHSCRDGLGHGDVESVSRIVSVTAVVRLTLRISVAEEP